MAAPARGPAGGPTQSDSESSDSDAAVAIEFSMHHQGQEQPFDPPCLNDCEHVIHRRHCAEVVHTDQRRRKIAGCHD